MSEAIESGDPHDCDCTFEQSPGVLGPVRGTDCGDSAAAPGDLARVHEEEGGAVLNGYAYSYYGKQMALHEVLRANLTVIANRIVVG